MPRAAARTADPPSAEKGPLVFNGKPLVPNDHIYVSAPWDDRDGEPYLIARVLEVVQPTPKSLLPAYVSADAPSSTKSSSRAETPTGKETSAGRVVVSAHELRVRVAYYFRTRDITNRYVADHRLLVAAMHADTVPASYVRGLCTVRHREHIEELDVYKREKDTFYWHQLYDRYLHRYFDAVPTYKVQNAPADVLKHLQDNFEFVLCEVGTGSELCDAQRGCSVCRKWAAFADSVTCARCSKVFHLGCVDPPLAAKPKAGYGWSCAPCNKAYEEEIEEAAECGFRPGPPARKAGIAGGGSGNGTASPYGGSQMLHASKKGKAREVGADVRTDPHDWHMTNGWPFRYFGMHAHAYNVMDPHDSLHPRASTRLGNKFQCVVPNWDPVRKQQEAPPEQRQYFQPKRSRASTPVGKGDREKARKTKQVEAPPRGEDEAVNVIWRPTDKYSDKSLAELFERVKKMAMYNTAGVDALNRALVLFDAKNGDVTEAILALRKVSLGSLGHVYWNEEERKKLADGAQQHHNDIEEIAKLLPNKKMGDVVKRYYVQVGHTLQEDEPTQPEEKASAVAARSKKTARRRARAADDADLESTETVDEDSDRGSVAPPARTPFQRRNRFCAICSTTETPKWYWCPNNISELEVKPNPLVMCESCGIRWRHYGAQYLPYGDEIKPLPDRKKKAKAASEEGKKEATPVPAPPPVKEPTPPPPKPVVVAKPCLLCKRFEPKTALFQCNNCTISYHASCFGIDLDWDWPHEEWLCHMCERDQERNPLCLHPFCVLCPTPKDIDKEMPMTALDCMKETELSNYVHLLCAVWHRELQLGAPAIVSPVEAFTLLPPQRQQAVCTLCKQKDVGTTVKCEDCSKHVHVACAWNSGWKFAFEVQSVRNKKRPPKDAVLVKFKETEGILQPCLWCPDHHFTHAERKTYDLGARDQATKLMYVRTYKTVKFPDAPLLLRQGRRLEAVLQSAIKIKSPSPAQPRARGGRASLLASIIDEEGEAQEEAAPRPAKKRRTASTTPAASPASSRAARPAKAKSVTPIEQKVSIPTTPIEAVTVPAARPKPAVKARPKREPIEEPLDHVDSAAVDPATVEADPEAAAPGSLVSTSRRARVPKRPKHFSPPPPLPKKVVKKRRSRVGPADETAPLAPIVNGTDSEGQRTSADLADLHALLTKVTAGEALSPTDQSGSQTSQALKDTILADLPALSASPKLPDFVDLKSPFFSAATAAPHMIDPVIYTAHTAQPSAQAGPPGPNAGARGSPPHDSSMALDPALEALTAMAAARADSRDAEVAATSTERGRPEAANSESTPTEQETIHAFAVLAGLQAPPQRDGRPDSATAEIKESGHDGVGSGVPEADEGADGPSAAGPSDEPPSASSNTVSAQSTAVEAADGDDAPDTPSGRPKRKTRAPAALRETTAYLDAASGPESSGLGPNSPRPQSPAHVEPVQAHPILDYVRAHESAQQSFRVETPDDSDAASDRYDSPALPNLSPITSAAPFNPISLGSPLAHVESLPTPPHLADTSLPSLPPLPATASPSRPTPQKRRKSNTGGSTGPPITCANCGTSDSPLFRRDSEGRQLCNSCGLYFKTHGRDRPQKVIARAIGAARMQKRKQAEEEGGSPGAGGSGSAGGSAKRAKKSGVPLPLRAMPPLLPHAPSQPSPLQPTPAFAYGDYLPYPPNGAYPGPAASGSGERPSTSRSSSAGASTLDNTLSSGYPADYPAPYGYGPPNGQPTAPYEARAYDQQLPPLPPHLQRPYPPHQPYQAGYSGGPPPLGSEMSSLSRMSPRYGAATPPSHERPPQAGGQPDYYEASNGRDRPVDAEILQRHALESLAAQALTFGAAGPDRASLAQARSSADRGFHSSLLGDDSRPSTSDGMQPTGGVAAPTSAAPSGSSTAPSGASTHPLAARLQAHDVLEHRGQPSPPPSASAMPLGELFPGFSAPPAGAPPSQSEADDTA
ncbi:hypothetical protein JCM8202_000634 [Rhodotorula sphaerocarpa]